MSDTLAKGLAERIRQELVDIAKDTVSKKRPDVAATLDTRLRWTAWEELQ